MGEDTKLFFRELRVGGSVLGGSVFIFFQMCNGRHCVHPSQSAAIDLTGDEGIQRLNSSLRWGLQAEMAADPVLLGMHADEARVFFVS